MGNRIRVNEINDRTKKRDILYYIIPLITLLAYLMVRCLKSGAHEASGYYLIHYLYTYKHGFIPRGLVGEILSLFFDKITDEITRNVIFIFSVMLIVCASLCIGRALSKVKNDSETYKYVMALILLLCIMPYSFRAYFDDMKLDKILWALSLLAMFLMNSKIGVYFVPIICVTATLINPVFLFCSMILVSIAMLYNYFESSFSKKWLILCFVSYSSMIAIGIFGSISEKHLGFDSAKELILYYFSRYDGVLPERTLEFMAEECMIDYFLPLKEFVKAAFDYYCIEWENGWCVLFNLVFVSVPVYSVLTLFWHKAIKAENNKPRKFIYFLCMISPLVEIAPIIMSWESSKYFGNNIMVQLCLIVYFLTQKNETILNVIRSFMKMCQENILITSAITIYAGMFIFSSN